ncbi:aspartate kinase [Kibdelosporangium persicum]|uniref:Aspartokinase n=1 Tax=Kibdelosporangium persicum TaxID=2698649 RepID=A0ABX2F6A9_9PSEU|nr:aspartate kinase [Kibdelosporangium persicum]NRN66889.1 Aspartate kinase [Kibdelosporangium persicum]
MDITVQKYGGSSLATDEQVLAVARQVARAHGTGAVIVVVSARGDATDRLVAAASSISAAPDLAEVDKLLATGENAAAALLTIALRSVGVPAVSMTGPQAGLHATGRPGSGVVDRVDVTPVRDWLVRDHVVVVAGFQAAGPDGAIITLGRGGSDTSAIALAIAHGARCEIYTDVDGIRQADPRVIPAPPLLPSLDAHTMAEMAYSGARVMHSRAVELAAAHGIDFTVRHSSGRGDGTTITGDLEARVGVTAITHVSDVAQLVVRAGGSFLEIAADVLDVLAESAIPVDSVTWRDGLSCCIPESSAVDALAALPGAWLRRSVATVSLVGAGLLSRPGLTALALRAFLDTGIDAECVSCTQVRTTFLVDRATLPDAVAALYKQFGLDGDLSALATA